MIAKAVAKYIRISPSKMREVIKLIKGKKIDDAIGILRLLNKKAAKILLKILYSGLANAKRIPNLEQSNLYISDAFADGGPSLKRYQANAMGRASVLKKRTSHVCIKLDILEPSKLIQPKIAKKVKDRKLDKDNKEKTPKKIDNKSKIVISKATNKTQKGVKRGS